MGKPIIATTYWTTTTVLLTLLGLCEGECVTWLWSMDKKAEDMQPDSAQMT